MKKIITAIGDESLNLKLRKLDEVEILKRDICYLEGIDECLEIESNIDIIILNESLFNDNLEDWLLKISNLDIEIYLIVDKKHFMEEFERIKNIRLFNNEMEVLNVLKDDNVEEIKYEYKEKCIKVISILGSFGVGKTVVGCLIGKKLSKTNKVLIINFDIFNDNIRFLFNLKNNYIYKDIKDLIIKVDKNLDVLSGIQYVFNEDNKINKDKVRLLIEEFKKNYDFIVIDTSSELNLKYVKTIIPNCDYNIFIIEANLLELKKAKDLLEIYLMDFGLLPDKTGIFINKYNRCSIDLNIIQNVLSEIKIIGKINYSPSINSFINSYAKNDLMIEDMKKFTNKIGGKNGRFIRFK